MSEQKVKFNELLDKYCSEQKKTCVITQDLYDKVLNAIQLDSRTKYDDGAKFKHWCKNPFRVETIGARNLLYCSNLLQLRKRPLTPFCAANFLIAY